MKLSNHSWLSFLMLIILDRRIKYTRELPSLIQVLYNLGYIFISEYSASTIFTFHWHSLFNHIQYSPIFTFHSHSLFTQIHYSTIFTFHSHSLFTHIHFSLTFTFHSHSLFTHIHFSLTFTIHFSLTFTIHSHSLFTHIHFSLTERTKQITVISVSLIFHGFGQMSKFASITFTHIHFSLTFTFQSRSLFTHIHY